MNTSEVAERMNISPRELRKFLRADPEFKNAGCGGKYTFTAADITRLKKRYSGYKNGDLKRVNVRDKKPITKKVEKPSAQEVLVTSGLPLTVLRARKLSKTVQAQRDIINAAREARLIQALKDNGLYLGA